MRRGVLVVITTIVGVVLLLHYKTPALDAQRQVAATTPSPTVRPVERRPVPTAPPPTRRPTLATRPLAIVPTRRPTPVPTRKPTPAPVARAYTGSTAQTRYGPVQVQIVVQGTRITDVRNLQMPADTQRSQEISDYAGPQLRQEALNAQSSNIDTVSGASYTSEGYRESLQAAIDAAHM